MAHDLIELARDHATGTRFERAALEHLAHTIGCEVAFFSLRGHEDTPTTLGMPEGLVARAVASFERYGRELLPVKRRALARRGVAVDTDVLGTRGVERLGYHRELARRVGGRHSLLAYPSFGGRVMGVVMLGRTGSAFSERDVERMEEELSALGVARAAFGLPVVPDPLPPSAATRFLDRLGFPPRPVEVARVTARGNTISVRDIAGERRMIAASGRSELVWTRAKLSDPSESGWPYVNLFHVAAALAKRRRRALFVGGGGGVALHQFASRYPGIELDLAEIDPRVVELARAHYALDSVPGLTVHVIDGADLVEQASAARWDVIVVDAYDAGSVAERLAGRRFFRAARRALFRGGTLALNLIGTLDGQGELPGVVESLRGAIGPVRVVPVVEPSLPFAANALRNLVLVAVAER